MNLSQFANSEEIRKEVFGYINNHIEVYALKKLKAGEDTSGIKNAFDIIKESESRMIAEFAVKRDIKKLDRAV